MNNGHDRILTACSSNPEGVPRAFARNTTVPLSPSPVKGSQVEAFGDFPADLIPPLAQPTEPGQVANLAAWMLQSATRMDPASIRVGLDEGAAILGLAGCIDQLLLPLMRQVGVMWAAGRLEFAQERMTTEATRGWLDGRKAYAPPPRHPKPVLLACGPRDQHTIGLESLALLLRFQGWPCRVLGARMSVSDLITATRASGPAAVVVVSHLGSTRPYAVTVINEIERLGYRVFYAGNAFSGATGLTTVAGDYLGTSMELACARLCTELAG
jgi:methanogenic corrinoid protein MtbC1